METRWDGDPATRAAFLGGTMVQLERWVGIQQRKSDTGRRHSAVERGAIVLGQSQRFSSEGQLAKSGSVFAVVTGRERNLLASSG